MAYCKYYKQQKYVSYDSGSTWAAMQEFQPGELYEKYSLDCPSSDLVYRWVLVENGYICEGKNLYRKEVYQVSSDGLIYTNVYPTTFRATGQPVEVNSSYCNNKFEGHYGIDEINVEHYCPVGYVWDEAMNACRAICTSHYHWNPVTKRCEMIDPIKIVKCQSESDELTEYDVKYYVDSYYTVVGNYLYTYKYTLTSATIGDCVTTIGPFAFCYGFEPCTGLTSIVIPDSVTTISNNAFYKCSGLTSVTLSNILTTIGESAFAGCSSLTNLRMPNSVRTISGGAFSNCSGLTSINIPNGITTINNSTFLNCINLPSISIPNSVTSIGASAFTNCTNLTSITIPSGVTSIQQETFKNCSGLTSINIHSGITSIGGWSFEGCSGLNTITIPSGVTSIGSGAFRNCSGLTGIAIEATTPPELGFDVFSGTNDCPIIVPCDSLNLYKSATNWSNYSNRIYPSAPCPIKFEAYYSDTTEYTVYCNSSTTLTTAETRSYSTAYTSTMTAASIGDCVEEIGYNAFNNCSGLTSLVIPNSVTSIGNYAFHYCSGLTSINIPSGLTEINGGVFNGCSSLASVTIPSGVNSIGNGAFGGCSSLSSVTIPNNVSSIGSNAFNGCSGLRNIDMSDNITSIGYGAFENCYILSSVTIPSGVTVIDESVFKNCRSLTSVTIPSGVTSIKYDSFWGCSGLTSITVEATTPPTMQTSSSGGSFEYTNNCPIYVPCDSLSAYTSANGWSLYANRLRGIPPCTYYKLQSTYSDSTTYVVGCNASTTLTSGETRGHSTSYQEMTSAVIGDCTEEIGYWAFNSFYSLTNVSIPNTVTSIGEGAFAHTSLSSITMPNSVTTIGDYAFFNCSGLTSLNIPDSVTSIGEWSFKFCSGLTSVTIGSGLTTVQQDSFSYCTALPSITIPDTVTIIGSYAFQYDSGLTTVSIGSGITTIYPGAFDNCSALTSITIEATTPPSLTLAPTAFENTNNCPIYVPCESVYVYKSASGWSNYASRIQGIPPCEQQQSKLIATYTDYTVYSIECDSSTTLSSTEVSGGTGTSAITTAIIGDCVEEVGSYAFYRFYDLTSVTIGSGVTNIGGAAFQYCSGLTSINIPDSVSRIESNAFQRCSGATELEIGSGITYIGNTAFRYCSALTSITIDATTPPTLGTNVFNNTNDCPIYVPCTVVDTYKSAWSAYASRILGYGCKPKLEVIYTDTSNYTVNCNSSTTLSWSEVRSGTGATAITSANVGNCVEVIENDAFGSLSDLTSVTMPSGITSIGNYAFEYCSGLTAITINATTPPTLGDFVFRNCPNLQAIYVPASAVNTYKSASGWSSYSSIIQAIS